MDSATRMRGGPSRRTVLGAAVGLPLATVATRPASAEPAMLPVGMNLAGIADWDPGFPFLNLMWGARPWLTRGVSGHGPWDSGQQAHLRLDADGYPLEIPFTAPGAPEPHSVFTVLPNTMRAGRYVVLYDGEGVIGGIGGTKVVAALPGRVVVTMAHKGGESIEGLAILKSTHRNHVRNIRILAAEHETADLDRNPFRPELLEFCKPWHCLRFMDWLGTNNSINQHWALRKRRAFYTQVGTNGDVLEIFGTSMKPWELAWPSGVAIEVCVQLANLTQCDAWLCVPHLADDDYITRMALLVKAQLDPRRKVYLEFSNEIWNWGFLQSQWMLRSEVTGALVEAAGAPSPWKAGTRPTAFRNGMVVPGQGEGINHPERIGALFRRCFKIWEDVFSGPDRARLVRVAGVQGSWPDSMQRTLNWVQANGGCDALSPAGYFLPDDAIYARWEAAGGGLTADQVITDMTPTVPAAAAVARQAGLMAKAAGVRLVAYEGGQHIQPLGQAVKPYNAALAAAQVHPGMADLYRQLMVAHAAAGFDLFCAFNSVGVRGARYGSWGHIEHYGQSPAEAPKYRAILAANTPR